ncbi:hypothetical protein [Varunaivibrio sulfuroxidans]|nr:hypothetical protein [Varunaivibrio sulfuroxidans]WES31628.1 hypothetical protein P3M64_04455 [Varunaivibrio sulfuroxidans]
MMAHKAMFPMMAPASAARLGRLPAAAHPPVAAEQTLVVGPPPAGREAGRLVR